jgi:hypothetical protein
MTTQTPQTKTEVLDLIRSSHDALEQAIARMSDGQISAPTADGGWSVKDLMAHITAWERILLRSHIEGRPYAQAVANDGPLPQFTTVDEINDWLYQQSKATPLADVRENFQSTYQQVLTAIQQMTEADLLAGQSRVRPHVSMLEAIAGNTWEHYDEHAATIRRLAAEGNEQH